MKKCIDHFKPVNSGLCFLSFQNLLKYYRLDPELGKFKAVSGSGINHSGSADPPHCSEG